MAITRVQGNTHQNGATSSSTVAVTLGAPVGTGNMLCVSIGSVHTSGTQTFTVTDDKGNTYTSVDALADTGNSFAFGTAYILNVTNAPTVITATIRIAGTPTAETFASIQVDEFSGVSAFDGHAINNQVSPATTANAVTSTAITTTANGDLIYGTVVDILGGGTITKGTPFTQDLSVASAYMTEHLIQSTAGSIAATFTASVSTDAWITAVMAFKAATSSGPILGRAPPNIFRPGQGPDFGLSTPYNTFIPSTAPGLQALAAAGKAMATARGLLSGALPITVRMAAMGKASGNVAASAAVNARSAAMAKASDSVVGMAAMSARSVAIATGSAASSGKASLMAVSAAMAKAVVTFRGLIALSGRATAMATGRAAGAFGLALRSTAAAMGKASAAISGRAPLIGAGKAQGQARAAISVIAGLQALSAASKAMATAMGSLTVVANLAALSAASSAMAKATGAMTFRAGLAATSHAMATAQAAATGITSLAARSTALAKARVGIAGGAMLAAASTAMATARAVSSGAVSLAARGAAMAKGAVPVNAIAALTALAARSAAMAKAASAGPLSIGGGIGAIFYEWLIRARRRGRR
jgi:hypothetical protein